VASGRLEATATLLRWKKILKPIDNFLSPLDQLCCFTTIHAGQIVTVLASGTSLTIEFSDWETMAITRTTTQTVRSIRGQRPRTAANNS